MNYEDYKTQAKRTEPERNGKALTRLQASFIKHFVQDGHPLADLNKFSEVVDALKRSVFYGTNDLENKLQYYMHSDPDNDSFLNERDPEAYISPEDEELVHAAVGILSEACELSQALFSSVSLKGEDRDPVDEVNVLEELGDLEWYKSILTRRFGFSQDKVLSANLNKLSKRFDKGVHDQDKARNRDVTQERDSLDRDYNEDEQEVS